jgi:tetratricopeptide (TPR) repeat protein
MERTGRGEKDFIGGAEMRVKIIVLGLAFLGFALLLMGCNSADKDKAAGGQKAVEVKKTPAEKDKARLLKKIDSKFEDPDAHYELGRVYQAEGLWAYALHHYEVALNFNPVHREAQAARIKVLMDGGDMTMAKLLADEYIRQASDSAEESLRLALAFQEQTLDEYAMTCYQQALSLAPNSAKINRQIGYYYLSKSDKETAKNYLTRSFQLNPNQPEVAGELGRMGVAVQIPRKTEKNTKKLDKMVEKSEK